MFFPTVTTTCQLDLLHLAIWCKRGSKSVCVWEGYSVCEGLCPSAVCYCTFITLFYLSFFLSFFLFLYFFYNFLSLPSSTLQFFLVSLSVCLSISVSYPIIKLWNRSPVNDRWHWFLRENYNQWLLAFISTLLNKTLNYNSKISRGEIHQR